MITSFVIGLLAVLFAYLNRYENIKYGLKISFSLIFLFLSLRYKYGNDYLAYFNTFFEINDYDFYDFTSNRMEPGWQLLCRLFEPFGFFALIFALAVFNCVVYYKFIETYVPEKYYWFAVLIYVFTPDFLMISLTAIRQATAVLLFIISLKYIIRKKIIPYLLCIGGAALLHTSAIILLPLYLFGYLNFKINKLSGFIIGFLFVLLFSFGVRSFLRDNISNLISIYFIDYTVYQGVSVLGTGLGVIWYAGLALITMYYERYQTREKGLIFKLAIIGIFFIPLSLIVPMIGRLDMYFLFATIVTLPTILMSLKNQISKLVLTLLLIIFTLSQFFGFMNSSTYGRPFSTYQTIFSSPQIF
jgi:hypothetical protein